MAQAALVESCMDVARGTVRARLRAALPAAAAGDAQLPHHRDRDRAPDDVIFSPAEEEVAAQSGRPRAETPTNSSRWRPRRRSGSHAVAGLVSLARGARWGCGCARRWQCNASCPRGDLPVCAATLLAGPKEGSPRGITTARGASGGARGCRARRRPRGCIPGKSSPPPLMRSTSSSPAAQPPQFARRDEQEPAQPTHRPQGR